MDTKYQTQVEELKKQIVDNSSSLFQISAIVSELSNIVEFNQSDKAEVQLAQDYLERILPMYFYFEKCINRVMQDTWKYRLNELYDIQYITCSKFTEDYMEIIREINTYFIKKVKITVDLQQTVKTTCRYIRKSLAAESFLNANTKEKINTKCDKALNFDPDTSGRDKLIRLTDVLCTISKIIQRGQNKKMGYRPEELLLLGDLLIDEKFLTA